MCNVSFLYRWNVPRPCGVVGLCTYGLASPAFAIAARAAMCASPTPDSKQLEAGLEHEGSATGLRSPLGKRVVQVLGLDVPHGSMQGPAQALVQSIVHPRRVRQAIKFAQLRMQSILPSHLDSIDASSSRCRARGEGSRVSAAPEVSALISLKPASAVDSFSCVKKPTASAKVHFPLASRRTLVGLSASSRSPATAARASAAANTDSTLATSCCAFEDPTFTLIVWNSSTSPSGSSSERTTPFRRRCDTMFVAWLPCPSTSASRGLEKPRAAEAK
eukprot:scaffold1410_cov242-Pinguiococcus_pyrenoidosus.AAC.10